MLKALNRVLRLTSVC